MRYFLFETNWGSYIIPRWSLEDACRHLEAIDKRVTEGERHFISEVVSEDFHVVRQGFILQYRGWTFRVATPDPVDGMPWRMMLARVNEPIPDGWHRCVYINMGVKLV